MTVSHRWTVRDIEGLPDDGSRYEIIDGELYVSKQPHYYHQLICTRMVYSLGDWNRHALSGEASLAPGAIFSDDDAVAPDLVWISNERLTSALGTDGKLHDAPELVIEVLSPGKENERRDCDVKLGLYSRRGVLEYWVIDWRGRSIEVYRRQGSDLLLAQIVREGEILKTDVLPRFSCSIDELFSGIPQQ